MSFLGTVQLVIMGVCGTGKTTLAALLAEWLGCGLAEGDQFHPPANIAKMSAGIPLEDTDRWPWLEQIAHWIRQQDQAGHSAVVTCSALKRAYRDVLRTGSPRIWFVHLYGSRDLIRQRMLGRSGHFMPASLVDSQFAILEPLGPDERGVALDIAATPEANAAAVFAVLAALELELNLQETGMDQPTLEDLPREERDAQGLDGRR